MTTGTEPFSQLALCSALRGEITIKEAETLVANRLATQLNEHEPRQYAPMTMEVFAYAQDRAAGKIAREQGLAVKNGTWLSITSSLRSSNNAERELMEWAKALCEASKSYKAVDQLTEHIAKIDGVVFPYSEFKLGLAVQLMDSNDSRRGNSK